MYSVLNKNPGLNCLKLIRDIQRYHPMQNEWDNIAEGAHSFGHIGNMKFAPITSVGVERFFSWYTSVLRPNRRSFNFDNLSTYMVYHCYQDQDEYGSIS
jgi:hypothetical protein